MSEVKWIKILTDIFDDEKILLIESMPEADSLIVIWFKLLCLAGKNNNSGVFVMTNKIPYTDEMLSTIFRRKIATVKLALQTFMRFGMIEIVNNVITIPNWSKHQTLDQLEKNKEYMRNYMQIYRQKQKELAYGEECKTNSKTNSKTNVKSLDKDKDKDKDKDNIYNKKLLAFGTYKRIKLTNNQYNSLIYDFSKDIIDKQIELLDEYIEINNNKNKYKNFNLVIRKSIRENWFSKKSLTQKNKKIIEKPEWYEDYEKSLKYAKKEKISKEETENIINTAKDLFK